MGLQGRPIKGSHPNQRERKLTAQTTGKATQYAKEQTKSQIQSKIKSQRIPAEQSKFREEVRLATRGQERSATGTGNAGPTSRGAGDLPRLGTGIVRFWQNK